MEISLKNEDAAKMIKARPGIKAVLSIEEPL
jgi:hypothetical protein